jgi:AcrR family transcriptional regulator
LVALELFTRQGFHGTNIREIARLADVSQGAIYTYYASKEAIFEGLARSYRVPGQFRRLVGQFLGYTGNGSHAELVLSTDLFE